MKSVMLALLSLLVATPSFAASKAEVAAAGCNTLEQARKLDPTAARIKYRLIGDKQCWYSEAWLAKQATSTAQAQKTEAPSVQQPRVAGAVPTAIIKRVFKQVEKQLEKNYVDNPEIYVDLDPNNVGDDLDDILLILCGGPCPQLNQDLSPYAKSHRD